LGINGRKNPLVWLDDNSNNCQELIDQLPAEEETEDECSHFSLEEIREVLKKSQAAEEMTRHLHALKSSELFQDLPVSSPYQSHVEEVEEEGLMIDDMIRQLSELEGSYQDIPVTMSSHGSQDFEENLSSFQKDPMDCQMD
jgi:hypothetical protein